MKTKAFLVLGIFALALAALRPLAADEPGKVEIKATRDHIDFLVNGQLATRYVISPDAAKPYFWPLNAPAGVPVTRAWPMEKGQPGESKDHPHQKSAWFCHGDVIPEGIELKVRSKDKRVKGVDFWAETKGHGKIVCTEVGKPTSGDKSQARIVTKNEWRTADGMKILDETRGISLYDLGDARLLVLDIDLHASVAPITFGDTKEGAMGVRVNDQIREQKGNGRLVNAGGKAGEKGCWGQLAAWCDYSGEVGGKKVGIALFDDPKNPHPAAWHSRGYGLMAANPFGRVESKFPAVKGRTDLVRLGKGEHLRLRYGILVHTGDAREGQVAEQFQRFVKLRGAE
jgi:hypothetical protein